MRCASNIERMFLLLSTLPFEQSHFHDEGKLGPHPRQVYQIPLPDTSITWPYIQCANLDALYPTDFPRLAHRVLYFSKVQNPSDDVCARPPQLLRQPSYLRVFYPTASHS